MSVLPGIPVVSPVRIAPQVRSAAVTAAAADGASALAGAKQSQESATVTRTVENELGRDAFLQLLVLQLRNQDPLDPQDNQQMLAQLAQFSALEQQNNLSESFETLTGNVDQLNFISASQLLGRSVTGVDLNGVPREGVVESVHLDGSVVVLTVDGAPMSMAGVLGIAPPAAAESASTAKGRY